MTSCLRRSLSTSCLASWHLPKQIHRPQTKVILVAVVALTGVSLAFGLLHGMGLAIVFTAVWFRKIQKRSEEKRAAFDSQNQTVSTVTTVTVQPRVKVVPLPASHLQRNGPLRPLLISQVPIPIPTSIVQKKSTDQVYIRLLTEITMTIEGTYADLPMAGLYTMVFKKIMETSPKELDVRWVQLMCAGKIVNIDSTYGQQRLVNGSTLHLVGSDTVDPRSASFFGAVNRWLIDVCSKSLPKLTAAEADDLIQHAGFLIKKLEEERQAKGLTDKYPSNELLLNIWRQFRGELSSLKIARGLLTYHKKASGLETCNYISDILMKNLDSADHCWTKAEGNRELLRISDIATISNLVFGYYSEEPVYLDQTGYILPALVPETIMSSIDVLPTALVLLVLQYVNEYE